jgi:hypothetical protein
MKVHQLGRGLVANTFAAATDVDLGAELEEARGHRLAKACAASGYEDTSSGKKLILKHRCHLEFQMNARLTKSG